MLPPASQPHEQEQEQAQALAPAPAPAHPHSLKRRSSSRPMLPPPLSPPLLATVGAGTRESSSAATGAEP